MGTMIKINKTESCISFRLVSNNPNIPQEHRRSSNFYITKQEFTQLLHNSIGIFRDGYCFGDFRIGFNNMLDMKFYWIEENSINKVYGYTQIARCSLKPIIDLYYGSDDCITLIDDSYKRKQPKIIMNPTGAIRFKVIKEDKYLRKQFSKVISNNLMRWQVDKIEIDSDWLDKSFFFTSYLNNKRDICGGVVYNADKRNYSVHT